ncbi:exonuclease [Hafnia phage yong3]|nr:exonuclease [Hafnia phage yong3]
MTVYVAEKTMAAFEEAVRRDQGGKFREFLGVVIPTMDDAYRPESGSRTHLGASLIGRPCARALFYGYRWAQKNNHSGRLLRLFNRGHLEEARFIALMLAAGMQVYQQDAEGKQFRISEVGGHFGGACDGVVIGCPDVQPGMPVLTEMKTHSDKSFKKVKAKGVKEAKPEHYVQMNVYMRKLGLGAALYLAVNKNDDEIYAEILPFDPVCADMYIDRGIRISTSIMLPERVSTSPTWFECKYCESAALCWRGAMPDMNCRTCQYAEPIPDGTWRCNFHNATIDKEQQKAGCKDYQVADYYGKE